MQNRNRLTDIEDKLVILPNGRGKWGGTNQGYGIKRHTLLYIK